MDTLLSSLTSAFPSLVFVSGNSFYWSPETQEVFYDYRNNEARGIWSLLHETGHALLGHTSYKADIELINMEVAAWEKAKELAKQFGTTIDEDHIQDCLDSYRDWIYRRSICPTCTTKCLQQNDMRHYRCFNCHTIWKVTPSRFCRPYRSVKNAQNAAPVFNVTENL